MLIQINLDTIDESTLEVVNLLHSHALEFYVWEKSIQSAKKWLNHRGLKFQVRKKDLKATLKSETFEFQSKDWCVIEIKLLELGVLCFPSSNLQTKLTA